LGGLRERIGTFKSNKRGLTVMTQSWGTIIWVKLCLTSCGLMGGAVGLGGRIVHMGTRKQKKSGRGKKETSGMKHRRITEGLELDSHYQQLTGH